MFKIHVIHEHRLDAETARRLSCIEDTLSAIDRRIHQMALNFSRLEAETTAIGDAVDSAVKVLNAIADEIKNGAANEARMNQLSDTLHAKAAALAEAITAGTPAEPPVDGGTGGDTGQPTT